MIRLFRPMAALAVAMLCGSLLGADPKPAPDADRQTLQGTWEPSYAYMGGRAAPPEILKELKIAFDKEQMTIGAVKVDFTLDATKTPKEIDLKSGEMNFRGIYRLEKEVLTMVWYKHGRDDPRPKEFNKDDKHPGLVYLELRKPKPADKDAK